MNPRGGPGRRPKPTVLHKLHGTGEPARLAKRKHEPQGLTNLTVDTTPPADFTDGEREQWHYHVGLCPPSMLKLLDRNTLISFCEVAERHKALRVALHEENARHPRTPYLMRTKAGLRISPTVNALDKAGMALLRLAMELGFTPASRSRVQVDPQHASKGEDEADPWKLLEVIQGGKKA